MAAGHDVRLVLTCIVVCDAVASAAHYLVTAVALYVIFADLTALFLLKQAVVT